MGDLLVVEHLIKKFGEMVAVNDLSFELREGEVLGMMGPNGAGKTTVFNLLTGTLRPESGTIIFGEVDITQMSPFNRCRRGIGRTHQIPRPFEKMTVFENLMVAAVHGGGLKQKQAREEIYEILELIGLTPVKDRFAGLCPCLTGNVWSWVGPLQQSRYCCYSMRWQAA